MALERRWLLLGTLLAIGCSKPLVTAKAPAPELPLHIECRGEGRPPVVLEAGLGNDSQVWSSVLPVIAKTTQVCAYDRAGMGASRRAAPRPHSNEMMAAELHELLRANGIPEPYVLVGHSMGGANVRYLAAKSPHAVAGLMLVDSVTEEQCTRFSALLPEATLAEFKQGLRNLPEGTDFETFCSGLERLKSVNPSLGSLPLVVLVRGKPQPPPPGASRELGLRLDAAWRSMQDELPRLSSRSAFVIVENSGHHIQLDRPEAVVAAVEELVASVRERRPPNQAAIAAKVH